MGNERQGAADFRPIVGIDLGTTNSAVAYIHKGKPDLLAAPNGERIIPSVVLIDQKGRVVVGEHARAALVAMPDRTIAAVKRRMGSNETIALAGQQFLPQEISALILKELKRYVDELYGEGEKEAVITVPAYFTDEQRRATKEAGELAGFVVERIINEPTAAALAFGLQNLEEDQHILVYDLGGGTFDVSVVEMMSGVLEVKSSTGNRHLGGEDFDWRLVDWFAERMISEYDADPRDDIRARALLKEEAERVKKRLSSEEAVTVELPLVTVKAGRPLGLFVQVTRGQFEALIDDMLAETMESVRQALRDAGVRPHDVDEVLLVGGSTRIPKVREYICGLFGKEPRQDVHPDEAVALGAAVQAGLKSGALSDSGLVATDVAPFSMGVAVVKEWLGAAVRPGGFSVVIPRNTTIPVKRTETYYTTAPGQTAVEIEVFQGEHEWVKHNHRLGNFILKGLPADGDRPEAIEVTFRYNLNGILEVTAACVSTGEAMTVTLQDALNRQSQGAYEESSAKLEELWNSAAEAALDEDESFCGLDDGDGSDWGQMGLDDDDELLENMVTDELREEAAKLRRSAEALLFRLKENQRASLKRMLFAVEELLAQDDPDERELQSVLDDLTDLLIELELEV